MLRFCKKARSAELSGPMSREGLKSLGFFSWADFSLKSRHLSR